MVGWMTLFRYPAALISCHWRKLKVSSGVVALWRDFNGCESFVQENLLSKGGLTVGIESKHLKLP